MGTVIRDDKNAATWVQNNSKVVTWILNSIDSSLSISLQSFSKASEMWFHLQSIYHQVNKARKFYFDSKLAKYNQGDRTFQEYYNGFLALQIEKYSIILATVKTEAKYEVQRIQEESHISQFFMNLKPEFESVRSALMNKEVSPDLKNCVQEVLQEETRLRSQHSLVDDTKAFVAPSSDDAVLLVPRTVQCLECKGYGHVAKNCKKTNFYNYCKRNGHINSDCTRRPARKRRYYQTRHPAKGPPQGNRNQITLLAQTTDADAASPDAMSLTPEQIRDMIQSSVQSSVNNSMDSTFSSMGISGQSLYIAFSSLPMSNISSWFIILEHLTILPGHLTI